MIVLVCPDRFKGTFAASVVAQHFARGVKRALPDARIVRLPMSDGGAGLLDALEASGVAHGHKRLVSGPLAEKRFARVGLLRRGNVAVVEAAQAAGLESIPRKRLNPLRATTFGVGQLVRCATALRPREIVVGLGGTGTNDGGMGFARALGVRFFDARQREAKAPLDHPVRIDASGLELALHSVKIRVASDVTNPLCGPRGATFVFGPQKGVTPALLPRLDRALFDLGRLYSDHCGADVVRARGAGAAGGLGAALIALLGAEIVPGVDWVAEQVGLERAIRRADVVVTGEGRVDAQTLDGKTVLGVVDRARREGKPVLVVGGSLGPGAERLRRRGATRIVAAAIPGAIADPSAIRWTTQHAVQSWMLESAATRAIRPRRKVRPQRRHRKVT